MSRNFAVSFLKLIFTGVVKWSVSCLINKQGWHDYQRFCPSKCEFLSLEGTLEEQCHHFQP